MCYYLTVVLPEKTDLFEIGDTIQEYDMAFTPINNEFIKSQLKKGELYLRATTNYCDCSTAIGYLNRDPEYLDLLNSKKVKTLKKKKWSEEQIDKWIKEKLNKKEIKLNKSVTSMEREAEIITWINLIKDLIRLNRALLNDCRQV